MSEFDVFNEDENINRKEAAAFEEWLIVEQEIDDIEEAQCSNNIGTVGCFEPSDDGLVRYSVKAVGTFAGQPTQAEDEASFNPVDRINESASEDYLTVHEDRILDAYIEKFE